jgi:hypothetical protein
LGIDLAPSPGAERANGGTDMLIRLSSFIEGLPMPSWIVLRDGPCHDGASAPAAQVVGRITADVELEARFAAHSWWMCHADDRIDFVPIEEAQDALRLAAQGCRHLDLGEERRRLDAVFGDRMFP